MAKQVILRPFRSEDLDSVIGLIVRVFGSTRSPEEQKRLWYWKFDGNPFSSMRVPYAWVLEHKGRIVGNTGQIAVPVKLGEKVVIAYTTCDFAVEEEYRTHGITLANKFWRNVEVPFLMSTSASEAAYRIYKVFGAKELMLGRTSWTRVRRSKNVLRILMNRRSGLVWKFLGNGWLLSVISVPLDSLLKMVNTVSTIRLLGERLQLAEVSRFGSEFDKLWGDVSQHYAILVARGSEYLNWRYIDYPLGRPRIISAYDDAGNLRGFAVAQISLSDDPRVAHILELFTKPGDTTAQQELLRGLLTYASEQEVDSIRANPFPLGIGKLLKRNLFLERITKHSSYLFKDNGVIPSNILHEEENWFASRGDPDALF